MGILVRKAALQEVPVIRDLALRTWPVAYRDILSADQLAYMLERMYSPAVLTEQMMGRGHLFLLACRDKAPLGFAAFEHAYEGSWRTRLHKLYVLPDAQGMGVGRALLDAVEHAARGAGDDVMELNVNRHNPALLWYQARGFSIVRDEVIDIGQGFVMDDHVLERPVEGA